MKLTIIFFLFSLFIHGYSYETARIDQMEVNGTLRITQGREQGLEIGDPGVLLRIPYASEDSADFVIVAYAEAIRVASRESYWYLKEVRVPQDLRRSEGLILVRRKFRNKDGKVKSRKVINLTNNYDVAYDDLERKIPGALSNKSLELARYQGGVTDSAHEVFGYYTLGVYDHSTDADSSQDFQSFGYEVGYEFSFEKISTKFDHFSLLGSYHNYKNLLGVEGLNVENREESYKILVNWYLRAPSGTIGKLLPYFGVGYKRGNTNLSHNSFENVLDYAIEAFPVFEAGLKYRFKVKNSARFGLRAKVSFDRNKLFLRDEAIQSEDIDNFNFDDLRFGIGLSYYF